MAREESMETFTGKGFYKLLKRYRIGYIYNHIFGCKPKKSQTVCIFLYDDEDGEIGGYHVFSDGKGNTKIV